MRFVHFASTCSPQGTDVHVLIDAIAAVMMLEEKELCRTGELAVAVMRETASLITGDLYKVRFTKYCRLSYLKSSVHNPE